MITLYDLVLQDDRRPSPYCWRAKFVLKHKGLAWRALTFFDESTVLAHAGILVVDEAFGDTIPGEPETLIAPHMTGRLVLRSLTKTWALAGLRVGYDTAIVPKHNLKMIDPSQFPGLKLVGVSYLREAINAIKLK